MLLPTSIAKLGKTELNSPSVSLQLEFPSKPLQLHPGDKFQVSQLLQGEGEVSVIRKASGAQIRSEGC